MNLQILQWYVLSNETFNSSNIKEELSNLQQYFNLTFLILKNSF